MRWLKKWDHNLKSGRNWFDIIIIIALSLLILLVYLAKSVCRVKTSIYWLLKEKEERPFVLVATSKILRFLHIMGICRILKHKLKSICHDTSIIFERIKRLLRDRFFPWRIPVRLCYRDLSETICSLNAWRCHGWWSWFIYSYTSSDW